MTNLLQIYEPGETPLPHADTTAIGIDLGTTHSVVAIATEEKAEVICDEQGRALLASVVTYFEDGSVEVGEPSPVGGGLGWGRKEAESLPITAPLLTSPL